jgi:hypothetical protein
MDVDEEVDSRANKRDKDPGAPGTRPPPQHHDTGSSYATEGEHQQQQQQQSETTPTQGKRRSSAKSANKASATAASSAAVAGSSSTASSSSSRRAAAASATSGGGRRRSTTSTDSMDQSGAYGHAAPSSSSGTSLASSNQPMRPFASMQASGGEVPVKLTPITGRVSRAKKGVPVHTCDICRPAKVSLWTATTFHMSFLAGRASFSDFWDYADLHSS